MPKKTKPWKIQKYLSIIFTPTIITAVVVLVIDLASVISLFSFLIGGVFSLMLWVVKLVAAGYIGIKISRMGGRVANALLAALLFGLIVGIVDIIGEVVYNLAASTGGIFHLTAYSLIFLPINLAIFSAIVAIITYIISQSD
jgi:hypothetical protein